MSKLFVKEDCSFKMKPSEAEKIYPAPLILPVSGADLENIVVSALEGGIGYWAGYYSALYGGD